MCCVLCYHSINFSNDLCEGILRYLAVSPFSADSGIKLRARRDSAPVTMEDVRDEIQAQLLSITASRICTSPEEACLPGFSGAKGEVGQKGRRGERGLCLSAFILLQHAFIGCKNAAPKGIKTEGLVFLVKDLLQ